MSLQYEYHGKDFGSFTDEQKDFFHNSLPWILMVADIGILCEESIEEIVRRHNKVVVSQTIKTEDLRPFIPTTANVITITSFEWAINRFANRIYLQSGGKPKDLCGEDWVKKVEEQYQKVQYAKKEKKEDKD